MQKLLLILFVALSLLPAPYVVFAASADTANTNAVAAVDLADFKPIVPVPGITDRDVTFPQYVNQLFKISLSLGAILAVLMIVYGGFEYMTSGVATEKKDGAKRIQGAVTGLILLIASYLVLFTINPCLVEINVFTQGTPSDCSPPVQTSDTTTTEDTADTTTEETTNGFAPLSGLPHSACIRQTTTQCAGGTTAVQICVVDQTYKTPPEGATCSQGETPKFLCASGCAEELQGQSLNPIPDGYRAGQCTATDGVTERYCCTNATKTNCSQSTAAQCPTPQVQVTVCKLLEGELDT